jgi:Uma2 family endonuclease
MAPATSTKLTYEDYCLLPDDGRRHEIIDGEHYVNPSPNTRHQRISKRIALAIATFAEPQGLGEVFYAPYDVLLSDINIVEPDIIYVSAARSRIITDANIKGAPDLVVEILSSGNRKYDEVVKFKLYDALGVAEYWIVDADNETVRIYRQSPTGFKQAPTGDAVTTPLLPGFSLTLRKIFDFSHYDTE